MSKSANADQNELMQGQQPQPQITSQMIMEIFGVGEEEAIKILQALPQLCQAAQPQLQQGQQFQQIQQESTDLNEFKSFMDIISSPIITPQERMMIFSVDAPTLFEIVTATNRLAAAGTPTKDAMARIAWTDQVTKNVNAKQIAEWILTVLMPRIINPLIQGQEQIIQILTAQAQAAQAQGQAGALPPGAIPPGAIPPGAIPPGAIPPGAAPTAQTKGQRYPWKNSKGDALKYNFMTDKKGKTVMSDSLKMDVIKDTIKIDDDGVLTADTTMTAAMVQTYMKDGKEQKVLKDPKELKKACDIWLVGMPCTDTHPPDGIVMNQDEVVGWTTPPTWDKGTQTVRCRITIFDKKSVTKIQAGKTDVSIGFFCDLNEEAGTFGQDAYEAVQRNIVFNHLAVGLDKGHGRCPDGTCGIITENNFQNKDKKDEEEIDWELYKDLPCVGDNHYSWMTQDMEEDETLSAEQRQALPESDFCGPGRSFPVPDCSHYSAALRMLPRYEGPGDKADIKACILRKGATLTCPGAVDEEMTLHEQLLKEKMGALVGMSKKLAENATGMAPEELEKLMDGMRELIWKLRDEIAIIRGVNISVSEPTMKDALAAMGDAAIMQHTISNQTKEVKEGKYKLEPGYPDTHIHFVDLDAKGNGKSTITDEHQHEVKEMVVQLTNEHTHNLVPTSSEEEPSMTDENKKKKDEASKKKDEASKYVEEMIKREHTALVDSIMDHNPSKDREFYETKSLDELKETKELLDAVSGGETFIPAGKDPAKDGTTKVNDAYAALEDRLRTK